MRDADQNLSIALGELHCLSPDRAASLAELRALSVARDCVEELLRSCVVQLRSLPEARQSWTDIACTLGSASVSATKQRFGSRAETADEQVAAFWEAFADCFAWDFLPIGFLHELYTSWLAERFPDSTPLSHETFTRRLKAPAETSGQWVHTRSRPGTRMNNSEPLCARTPLWSPPEGNRAIYGLRRVHTPAQNASLHQG